MKSFIIFFVLFVGILFTQNTFAYGWNTVSKKEACTLANKTEPFLEVSELPWKVVAGGSYIKSNNKLYYTLLVAPFDLYDWNTLVATKSFWTNIKQIFIYSYDCQTKTTKRLSQNLISLLPKTPKKNIYVTTYMDWHEWNLLSVKLDTQENDGDSFYLFAIKEKKLIDIRKFQWASVVDKRIERTFAFKYIDDLTVEIMWYSNSGGILKWVKWIVDIKNRTIIEVPYLEEKRPLPSYTY